MINAFPLGVAPGSRNLLLLVSLIALSGGCATVKVEAPDKPIEINLNVNITQESAREN